MASETAHSIFVVLLMVLPARPIPAQVVDTTTIRFIQVDSHAVRPYARGVGTREPTQPIVVFEGGSSRLVGWAIRRILASDAADGIGSR